jgi:hypothetical protein
MENKVSKVMDESNVQNLTKRVNHLVNQIQIMLETMEESVGILSKHLLGKTANLSLEEKLEGCSDGFFNFHLRELERVCGKIGFLGEHLKTLELNIVGSRREDEDSLGNS